MESLEIVLNSVQSLFQSFLTHLPRIVIGIVVLLITFFAARLVDRILRRTVLQRTQLRQSLAELLRKSVRAGIWVAGFLIVGMVVFPDLTVGNLLAVFGLGSVAIGFAFKDIFENFLAGILLLSREPFQLGDTIECEGIEGKVEQISIRDTMIRQADGQLVVVPNSVLFKNPVTVRTDQTRRRVSLACGVGYGENVDDAREVIRKAVQGLKTLDKEKPVDVFASGFGASSIDFEIRWWTGSQPREQKESRDEAVAAIKRALDEADIEIPFPYRTLTFKEPLETLARQSDTSA